MVRYDRYYFLFVVVLIALLHGPVNAQLLHPADTSWDGRWTPAGVNGDVNAVLRVGNTLYVGGNFSKQFGDDQAAGLVALNLQDSTWHDIGFRGSEVYALAYSDNHDVLYVGGRFPSMDGDTTIRHIAKWDGQDWSSIGGGGDGLDNLVRDIAIREGSQGDPDEIIIGGHFTTVGGAAAKGIARYRDSLGWDDMGASLDRIGPSNPTVAAIDIRFSHLWVGGSIDLVGPDTAEGLAIYSFDYDAWMAVDDGPEGPIECLDAFGNSSNFDHVVVGGAFSAINDSVAAQDIALYRSDTREWMPLDTGLGGRVVSVHGEPVGLGGAVIWAGGQFATTGDVFDTVNHIAYWNVDDGWTSVGGGVNQRVACIMRDFNDIYVGGSFLWTADSTYVNGLARFDAEGNWHGYGLGPEAPISDIYTDENGTVYYTGGFRYIGNKILWGLAVESDSFWQPQGKIFPSQAPQHIRARNDTIYVAGQNLVIDGQSYNYIAMYDGTQWKALGEGVNSRITTMEFGPYGDLYVGGYFSQIDGAFVSGGLARWDGFQWHNIPVTLTDDNDNREYIEDLTFDSLTGDLYIAGSFTMVNGIESRFIARYDGSWSAVGSVGVPIDPDFHRGKAVAIDALGRIFVGGDFGDGHSNPLYVWNGSAWDVAGGLPLCFDVTSIVNDGCNIYVGGSQYSSPSDCIGTGVVRYNGGSWFELGSGVIGSIKAMALSDRGLAVGGSFSRIGSTVSDLGFWTDLPDAATTYSLQVDTPVVGDTLRYGTVFPISFTTEQVVQLQVEYSLDSGKTWNVLYNYAEPDHALPWIVPDTNAEFCQIRIANADAACEYVAGDFFTITANPDLIVHRVTRPRGKYYTEPFAMGFHQISFENDSATCWPESYYETIDYSQWPFPVSTVADNSIFPDWGLYCGAFGEFECYDRIRPPRIVNPNRYLLWQIHKRKPWGGSCYGFVQVALLIFRYLGVNEESFHLVIDYLNDEPLSPFWRKVVNKYWIYQFAGKHEIYDFFHTGISPDRTLDTLIKSMQPGEYPRGLAMRRKVLEPKESKTTDASPAADSVKDRFGHAVMPYKITNVPDTAGIWYIYVYDNNGPNNESLIVRVDRTNQTWSYSGYDETKSDTGKGLVPYLPIIEFAGFAGEPRVTKSLNQSEPIVRIYQSSTENLLIRDSLGNRFGEDDTTFYEEIVDAAPIVVSNPDWPWNHPMGYMLTDGSYDITISDFEESTTDFVWQTDSAIYRYTRAGTDSAQTDMIHVDSGFGLFNPDATSKTATLVALNGDSTVGHFYYQLDSLDMNQDDSVMVQSSADSTLTVQNYGSAKTYALILWQTNSENQEYTQSITDIQLAGGGTQKIVPSWGSLTESPAQILMDNDADGIFEDTTLADLVLDADDDATGALPDNFDLGQNYPNPFNPATTIEFSLPARSAVTLRVYNVLGRVVKTLVDDELSAGSHSVVWDGTDSSGRSVASGVYFYRLITDRHTDSKKMLLLK